MSDSAQVLVVGSYVQDHAWITERFPRAGETCRAIGFNTGPGGKGFNQAVACARQGASTEFIGAIGEDLLGGIARKFADDEGLDCRWQVLNDHATAASSIVVDASGQNQIVVNLAANEHLAPAFLRDQSPAFDRARLLLVQLENNLDATTCALELGRERGLINVLNPAPIHRDLDAAALHACAVITPNETEFALLCRRFVDAAPDPDTLGEMDSSTLHTLARQLGVTTVIVTLGRHGCFVSHGADRRGDDAECYRIPGEEVQSIDSTGAGDAFSGALVAAMLRFTGDPFKRSVIHANRVAALSTETVGTAPAMPRFDAVVERFGA